MINFDSFHLLSFLFILFFILHQGTICGTCLECAIAEVFP
ncbi:putative signal peptide protein [Puccinia sorghi]|uniref:Putative signal peptide protein n=1 Tax=Puccinia sorghi TaxID=27349 RepID=A0A0L6V6E0_9BASI|nr:putative signal peptide protein [Puccinia sorghi]